MDSSDKAEIKEIVRGVLKDYDAQKPRLTTTDLTNAVRDGVQDAFSKVGLDVSTDDAKMSAQRDHHFLRKLRHHFDAIGKYTTRAIVGILVISLVYFIALFHKG